MRGIPVSSFLSKINFLQDSYRKHSDQIGMYIKHFQEVYGTLTDCNQEYNGIDADHNGLC